MPQPTNMALVILGMIESPDQIPESLVLFDPEDLGDPEAIRSAHLLRNSYRAAQEELGSTVAIAGVPPGPNVGQVNLPAADAHFTGSPELEAAENYLVDYLTPFINNPQA